ncbi:MAG: alpha/beta fold family hydrolase [Haloplasmataceae bacterium]|nr:alpha/beta fold family hydrolase [Haloplasmataceae bacterium]
MENLKLIGLDEIKLSIRRYIINNPKAIVICVHGMCEHSLRYDELANYLNQNNYSVITYDQRGHGESILEGEELGYLGKDGFNKMVEDLDVVVSYVKEKYEYKKVILLGHSMGSFVVQMYIQKYIKVHGAILSGSNYGQKLLSIGVILAKLSCVIKKEKSEGKLLDKMSFGNYNTAFSPNRTKFDWLSRENAEVDKYVADPKCGFICSNRFYYDFFRGLKQVAKESNIKKVNKKMPLLIISGDQDPVGNMGEGVKKLYNVYRKNLENVQMELYHGARHELFNENNKEEVYQDIVNWLKSQI